MDSGIHIPTYLSGRTETVPVAMWDVYLDRANAPAEEGEVTIQLGASSPIHPDDDGGWSVSAEHFGEDGQLNDSTGILNVSGPLGPRQYAEITSAAHEMLARGLERIGVRFASGGGALPGLSGAVRSLLELRAKLGKNFKTMAVGDTVSAAMPLLMTGGEVFADPLVRVGGLAVMGLVIDSSKSAKDSGLEVHKLVGEQVDKGIGVKGVPITTENIEQLAEQRGAFHAGFVAIAAHARGVSIQTMDTMVGTGVEYAARNALKLKIIDRIADEQTFLSLVAGSEQQQEITMADTPQTDEQPVIIAKEPEAIAPLAASPDSAEKPDWLVAIEAQSAQIAGLAASNVEVMASNVKTLEAVQALADQGVADKTTAANASTVLAFKARVDASDHGASPTAKGVMKIVAAMVGAGEDPESLVADLCAVGPLSAEADLLEQVTVVGASGQEGTVATELTASGHVERNGRAVPFDVGRSREIVQLIASHTNGDGVEDNAAINRELAKSFAVRMAN